MGHIRSPQADSDLDSIWYYVASESGSVETADRLIDSITDRFFLLSNFPNIGRRRDDEEVLILRVLRGSRNIEALFGH
jgi:plasmid stabilization system protein ParE